MSQRDPKAQRLPHRRMWRGEQWGLGTETEPKGGRKHTQRPGTRTGCVPDAGPHWLGQWFVPVLGAGVFPQGQGNCGLRQL